MLLLFPAATFLPEQIWMYHWPGTLAQAGPHSTMVLVCQTQLGVSFAISGNYLFAGRRIRGVFRTVDTGASWTKVDSGLPDTPSIYSLAVFGNYLFAGTGYGFYPAIHPGGSAFPGGNVFDPGTAEQAGLRSIMV